MPASSNVLQFHDNMTCSADDKPTPNTILALSRIVEVLFKLFTAFLCSIVVYLLSYITFFGFANNAVPEDMDEIEVSLASPQHHVFF